MRMLIATGAILLCALATLAEGGVLLSSLQRSLVLDSQIQNQLPQPGIAMAKAGDDHLVIRWSLNTTLQQTQADVDAIYNKVNLKLCYTPVSQTNRGWRKTNDNLTKDKSCGKAIVTQKYVDAAGNSTVWRIPKDVPGAVYFVRAYVLNANGTQIAYGQTTNANRTTNLIAIEPISGRHASIDVAAAIFSAFSIGSLLFFLVLESMKTMKSGSSK
ncbi:hypothetical protein R1flu_016472 [Riccia fluitans]|uniref:High-affinity nitrate transporter n=1 Tax=Riccia fluitans TaxID=41844 RepID=A0ABD1YLY2_9MARC